MSDSIVDFFKDEDIFITGCTGLTGKALVEKIIRSCNGVKNVFVLIRNLKDQSCEQRLENLKQSKIFDRVRQENPDALNKLVPIPGDLFELGLGISEKSVKLMENVSIVFHVAATVRFDESLKNSIILNTRGTYEICKLATKFKKLKIFIHVSTIYSNPYLKYVQEKIYPEKMHWKVALKLAENYDSQTINALTPKILGEFPNTYTFTKHMGESVVNDFRDKMKVIVVRPSIIHSALSEPFPGWFDNFNGILGLITGTYTGVVRGLYCNPSILIDLIPLDYCVKSIIIAGWWQLNREEEKEDTVSVYNLASSNIRSYSIKTLVSVSEKVKKLTAFNKCIWYPNFGLTNNYYYYYLRVYLFHVIPAIFLDLLLKLFKHEPFMLKLQRRALASQIVVRFFSFTEYKFETTRFIEIMEETKKQKEFTLDINLTSEKIASITLLGARRYLLHEDDSSIPTARIRLTILKYLSRGVKILFYGWILYKLTNNFF